MIIKKFFKILKLILNLQLNKLKKEMINLMIVKDIIKNHL